MLSLQDKVKIIELGRPTQLNFTLHFFLLLDYTMCYFFYCDGMDKTWSLSGFNKLKHLIKEQRCMKSLYFILIAV